MKLKDFVSARIAILVVALLIALLALNPSITSKGVIIKEVSGNSTLLTVGLSPPKEDIQPRSYERIIKINEFQINDLNDYQRAISTFKEGDIIRITTNKNQYNPVQFDDLGIIVSEAPTTNIRKGLDLVGGTRVVLQPVEKVSNEELDTAKENIDLRLNVYGLSDINVKRASDLSGNQFIILEVAGATQDEVRRLVGQQGKFEAKIGQETVFKGGENDITFVCRNDGTCSGIRSCNQANQGYICTFEFVIQLSSKAAKKHAEVTKDIPLNLSSTGGNYLAKPLDLFLDDKLIDSLQIDASLKGSETTSIVISGPGFGIDEQAAVEDGLKSMNHLQTVLITGSLPVKLEIYKIDSVSPSIGSEFIKNAFVVGLISMISVSVIIFIRYRIFKIALSMVINMIFELFLILGLTTLFRQNLDLAGIAGIIAAIGTGVDDQIVITDEILKGEISFYNWKEKVKHAFFIIILAFFTLVAAMLPLLWANVGLLKGFAIVTITGVSIGILITRPAFAKIIEILLKK